ncbi:MAG: hypothetical protein J6S87_00115 [Bacteroidales bacterium]|nr:hypothetical protein [Bacteroidales bacterium]
MKRLLLLAFSVVLSLTIWSAPFYVVDGRLGVSPNSLPPKDSIASVTVLKPSEAEYIYGERAADGAVIIRTKNYEKEHVVQEEHVVQTSPAVQKAQSKQLPRWARWVVLFILELLLIAVALRGLSQWQKADEDLPLDDLPEISPKMKKLGYDQLFLKVAFYVVEKQTTQRSQIAKRFSISPDRAERILTQLEKEGIVSPATNNKKRKVLFLDVAELSPMFERLDIK